MHQTVLITGGTGLIGKALSNYLTASNYQVIVLTRTQKEKFNSGLVKYSHWDIYNKKIDVEVVRAADYIIHLAGAGVMDKRWSTSYKQKIVESRTLSSRLITETVRNYPGKTKAIISASAIGWYGPDKIKDKKFTESEPASPDFLGETCRQWEDSISDVPANIRVCRLRTGIVLAEDGGAMAEFMKPIRFGVAAILGSGKQMVSWIHIEDLCRMYVHCMENKSMQGSYNAVADKPVSNETLTLQLAETTKGKFYIPVHVPAFVLKMVLGESSIEVLKSTTVSNEKIKRFGFNCKFPLILPAIENLVKRS